jgi:O-acetylserine/cysteine efflux transporter
MITRLPLAALIIASLFWGTAVSATKYALLGFGPITLLAISLIAGTAVLWTIVILRGHRPPPPWRRAVLLGLFEPALAYAGDLLGLARTSAANGALLSGLESVFIVLLAAVFLRERITGRITVALALALAGVAALEGTGSFAAAGLGDLLVLAGVLSAAAYTIVARGMGDESDPLTVTAYQFTTATILTLPAVTFVWAMHVETVPSHVAARFWLAAIFVGVIGYAASFLLYNYAIVRVRAAPASIIVNLIPVFGLASAVVWLGDPLTVARVLGAILIGLSVTIFTAAELADARNAARAGERSAGAGRERGVTRRSRGAGRAGGRRGGKGGRRDSGQAGAARGRGPASRLRPTRCGRGRRRRSPSGWCRRPPWPGRGRPRPSGRASRAPAPTNRPRR